MYVLSLERMIRCIVLPFFQQEFGPVIQDEVVDVGISRLYVSDIIECHSSGSVGLACGSVQIYRENEGTLVVYLMFQKLHVSHVD